jgi:NADH-quinone oxidoreductase E subunit
MSTAAIDEIVNKYQGSGRDALIPLLQEVQRELGFLSREAVVRISAELKLPASKIYGVATFYNQFRFRAPGRYHIQVCRGTACHVKGSKAVLDALERELRVAAGETTRDGLFSLEVVACIGACGLAPVIAIDGEFHAAVKPEKVGEIVGRYRSRAAAADAASTEAEAGGEQAGEATGEVAHA